MYIPPHFQEPNESAIDQLIRDFSLATFVANTAEGLEVNHLPMQWLPEQGEQGVLRCHVAKANTIWKTMEGGLEVVAIFQGPDAYISPSWYPTKQQHGKVVPTWNYAVVHLHGSCIAVPEADWLHEHLVSLVDENETSFAEPWAVSDAPEDYINALKRSIVGLEIEVSRVDAKWKMSQNQPRVNRQGVAAGLEDMNPVARGAMSDCNDEAI